MDQYDLIKFAAATNGEIYDPELNGGTWMYQAEETHETFEDFVEASNKDWNESTKEKFGEIAGFKFIAFFEMQARKGAPRQSLSVVDFVNTRVVIKGCDITEYV